MSGDEAPSLSGSGSSWGLDSWVPRLEVEPGEVRRLAEDFWEDIELLGEMREFVLEENF